MTTFRPECDCCAGRKDPSRSHIYRTGCRQCEARMVGRMPERIAAAIIAMAPDFSTFRAMVEAERKADTDNGITR